MAVSNPKSGRFFPLERDFQNLITSTRTYSLVIVNRDDFIKFYGNFLNSEKGLDDLALLYQEYQIHRGNSDDVNARNFLDLLIQEADEAGLALLEATADLSEYNVLTPKRGSTVNKNP